MLPRARWGEEDRAHTLTKIDILAEINMNYHLLAVASLFLGRLDSGTSV